MSRAFQRSCEANSRKALPAFLAQRRFTDSFVPATEEPFLIAEQSDAVTGESALGKGAGMRRNPTIKLIALGLAILVAAGAAYAYWTNSGSGSGSAETGTSAAVTVNQTSTVAGLYPGGPAEPLSGNFDNGNAGPVFVTAVNATIGSVTGPNITAGTPCDATDYALSGFPVAIGREIPAGTGIDSWTGGSVQLVNKPAANQDGCKAATVTIAYTSN